MIDFTVNKEGLQHNIEKARENNIIIPTIKQMHGFYCDQEIKSITFDVIVDFKDKDAPKLIKEIHDGLQAKYPDYQFSIVEDKDFTD